MNVVSDTLVFLVLSGFPSFYFVAFIFLTSLLLLMRSGLNKVAKKLGIDCAPAMTGWDYHGGWSHPVYDGFVVCSEHVEALLDAWQVRVRHYCLFRLAE